MTSPSRSCSTAASPRVSCSRAGRRRTPTSSPTCSGRSSPRPPTTCGRCIALGAVIVVAIGFTGRALLAVVLDEDSARVAGIPAGALNTVLAVLTAVTVVAAMRIVGVLLVAALMVLPGRDQPAARPLVPGHADRRGGRRRGRRRCSGCSRRGSGRSRPAARSCSSPRRCSRWRRSSPAPGGPAPRPTRSSPARTESTSVLRARLMAFIVTRIQIGDYDGWKPMFDLDGPGARREAPRAPGAAQRRRPERGVRRSSSSRRARRPTPRASASSPRACSIASPTTTARWSSRPPEDRRPGRV